MALNDIIRVFCFDTEIGVLGWDENRAVSFFQYKPDFLTSNRYLNLIPDTRIIRRIPTMQVFKQFNSDTFKGLPPMFADSLPDMFGNIIFKTWLEQNQKSMEAISVIEQLAYVADRGMGAFTYQPKKEIPLSATISIDHIVDVLQQVLALKGKTSGDGLNHESLLTIFKIGSSAGGARPKILIAKNKLDGHIIPGDVNSSNDYEHYIVKLNLDDEWGYNREQVEYAYYLTAVHCGITMMDSMLIDHRHFATKRFDRVGGEKMHVLTASGLTGWDFKDPANASYENLFELARFIRVPHTDIEALFKRMIFNLVFCNMDDHLKNHSFMYNQQHDTWRLSPAYDITYSLNPLLHYQKVSRALSVNQKRMNIELHDVKTIAEKFTIKNYKRIIDDVQAGIDYWHTCMRQLDIPLDIIERMAKDFVRLK